MLNRMIFISTLLGVSMAGVACDGPSQQSATGASKSGAAAQSTGTPMQASKAPTAPAPPANPTDAAFAKLLAEIVTEDGLVRYDLLREPTRMDALMSIRAGYANADPPLNPRETMALLINAYNANVLYFVASDTRDTPDLKSVKDVPGFFDGRAVQSAKTKNTLNDLEGRIRLLGDPRIHAAVNCGAMSCPALRNEPYLASRIDEQLDDQCRRWLDDMSKNRTMRESLALSPLFKWYADDFQTVPYGDAMGFVRKFSRPHGAIRDLLIGLKADVKVSYLTYDWRLNQAPIPEGSAAPAASMPAASAPSSPAATQSTDGPASQ